jgi:hypothetical protein
MKQVDVQAEKPVIRAIGCSAAGRPMAVRTLSSQVVLLQSTAGLLRFSQKPTSRQDQAKKEQDRESATIASLSIV